MSMFSQTIQDTPKAVRGILVATIGAYVLQIIPGVGSVVQAWGELIPSQVFTKGHIWRLVTYMFLHGGPMHLLFNMLALWMFGVELERRWGTRQFVWFYFIAGVGSGLFSVIMWNTPIIGASGALMALLAVYAWYFPEQRILLFFVFPVPVRIAVVIIGAMSLAFSFTGTGGGVAHLTHLGGIVVGALYLWLGPRVKGWYDGRIEQTLAHDTRSKYEETRKKETYFAEVIDPILKKISEEGMDGLSAKERKLLNDASRSNRAQFKNSKIIPFDSGKH